MAVYVIAHANVKDAEKMAEYAKGAGPTVAEHGGTFSMRGAVLETLAGDAEFNRAVMIEFPDADAARAWYRSNAYQALIANRNEAADMLFTLVEQA
jgi:uncharacterized protein (DUF1330 family)